MRFRSYLFPGFIFVFLAGAPAVYSRSGTTGSIRATATVSSPIGLLAPDLVSSAGADGSAGSTGWLLLSPRRGVVVMYNGEPIVGSKRTSISPDESTAGVLERINLPVAPGSGSVVTVIYTEN